MDGDPTRLGGQHRGHRGPRVEQTRAPGDEDHRHHHGHERGHRAPDRQGPLGGGTRHPPPHVIPSAGTSGTRPQSAKVSTMSMNPIRRMLVRSARPAARPTPSGPPVAW